MHCCIIIIYMISKQTYYINTISQYCFALNSNLRSILIQNSLVKLFLEDNLSFMFICSLCSTKHKIFKRLDLLWWQMFQLKYRKCRTDNWSLKTIYKPYPPGLDPSSDTIPFRLFNSSSTYFCLQTQSHKLYSCVNT